MLEKCAVFLLCINVVGVDQLVAAGLLAFTADIFCTLGLLIQVAFALAGAD